MLAATDQKGVASRPPLIGELAVDAHVEPADSWLPHPLRPIWRFLLNSFVLLGLAVEAGTPNQPTIYIEKAAELERPNMASFTVSDTSS
jgi:hypothetical protein